MMTNKRNTKHGRKGQPPSTVAEANDSEQQSQLLPPALPAMQIAHDLGNCLTGIRMLVQSFSQFLPADVDLQQHLTSLDRASVHATELCRHLQSSLGGQGEQTANEICDLDLSALVLAMQSLLEAMVQPGANVKFQLAEALPPVIASPTHVRQLLLDLLTNASEALEGDAGSITVRTGLLQPGESRDGGSETAHSETAHTDERVFLEITDTGCGVPQSELQQIFEPAFTTKKDGQGLGLASVLRIVRAYGGTVAVDSEVGRGTRICCAFPRATAEQMSQLPPPEATQRQAGAQAADSRPAMVLLVEDNDSARLTSKLLLESSSQRKMSVLAAGTGQEAMELFEERLDEITIIVLDANLPDCRGTELFEQMRQLAPGLPVIVASGMPEEQLITRLNGQPPDASRIKPFDGEMLIDKVNMVLRASDGIAEDAASCAGC